MLGGELDGEIIGLARMTDYHTTVMICEWLGIHCGVMWGDYDGNILKCKGKGPSFVVLAKGSYFVIVRVIAFSKFTS